MHHLLEVWFSWVENWGYLGIFLLMALESSIVPVPSEVVMPPAAYFAAQGQLSMVGVILAGTAGSYFGSAVSYWLSKWLGLPVIRRFGKYGFLKPEKIDAATAWVQRYGAGGVFFARLLPVVRHLISIPAGVAADLATVFTQVPANPELAGSDQLPLIVMVGIGESMAPAILGFGVLSLVALVASVGLRRMASA